jgi:hypothetical protein
MVRIFCGDRSWLVPKYQSPPVKKLVVVNPPQREESWSLLDRLVDWSIRVKPRVGGAAADSSCVLVPAF